MLTWIIDALLTAFVCLAFLVPLWLALVVIVTATKEARKRRATQQNHKRRKVSYEADKKEV